MDRIPRRSVTAEFKVDCRLVRGAGLAKCFGGYTKNKDIKTPAPANINQIPQKNGLATFQQQALVICVKLSDAINGEFYVWC